MAQLILEDGSRFAGKIFGDKRSISGEVGMYENVYYLSNWESTVIFTRLENCNFN